jgi:hypothetical protein
MYRLGRGVPKDTSKAVYWFSASAKNGNGAAADRLAAMGAPAVAPAQTAAAAPAPAAPAPAPAAPAITPPAASTPSVASVQPPQPAAPATTDNAPAAGSSATQSLTLPNILSPAPANGGSAPAAAAPAPAAPAPKPLKSLPNSQVAAMSAANPGAAGTDNSSAISLGLPLAPDAPSASAPAGPARIWIGTLHSDYDARLYWTQQVHRFPDLLQRLSLAVRPVNLGSGQGVWYKVLAGPFAGADAAGRICQAIRTRAPADDCSVVTD